jgi:hypothetical protein
MHVIAPSRLPAILIMIVDWLTVHDDEESVYKPLLVPFIALCLIFEFV